MASSESGGISKLIIKAYSDNKFSSPTREYTASINPEDISIAGGINYHLSQGIGAPGTLRYNTSAPKTLSFKLFFDNTGIIPGSEQPVEEQLEELKKVIYDVQENIHAPYYVRIIWGVIDFKGRLANLDTSYTRFKASGAPVRAEAAVRIIEEVDANTQSQRTSQASQTSSNTPGSATTNVVAADQANSVGESPEGAKGADKSAGGEDQASDAAKDPAAADAKEQAAADAAEQESATTPADAAEEGLTEDGAAIHEVKEGESLAGISNDKLKSPDVAPKLAELNGLDSLRGLPAGLKLAIPFSLAAMLAALLKKGVAYAKKGGGKLKEKGGSAYAAGKKKGGSAKAYAKEKGGKAKGATKKGAQSAKTKAGSTKDAAKEKGGDAKEATNEGAQSAKEKAKN